MKVGMSDFGLLVLLSLLLSVLSGYSCEPPVMKMKRAKFYGLIFIMLAMDCNYSPKLKVKEIKKENGHPVFILKKPIGPHNFKLIEIDPVSRNAIKYVWDVWCIRIGKISCPRFNSISYGVAPEGYAQDHPAGLPDPLVPGKEYCIAASYGKGYSSDCFKMPP
jgi:hypothetical protein